MPFPTRGMTPFLPGCQIQFNAAGQAVKSLAWQPPPSPVAFFGGVKVTGDNAEAATGQAQLFFSLSFFNYGRSSRKTHQGLISKGGWMPGFEKLLLAFCFLLPFSVSNHGCFVLLASVFFLVIMCLQNIKSPENYNNKEK